MSKKEIVVLVCLLVVVAAAAVFVGLKLTNQPKKAPAQALPLTELAAKAIPDAKELLAYTADDLLDLLGIKPDSYSDFVFLTSADGLAKREVIAVRAADKAKLEEIEQKLNAYLTQRKDETQNYLPDVYQLLTKTKVQTAGNTAVLVIGENAQEEAKALLAGE